jgi:hypothetical protein
MRTRVYNGKEQIFCEWRRRWVRLTPEEWVRQQLLHYMVEQLDYPASCIAVEVPVEKLSTVNCQLSIKQRCDAVVYDKSMRPLMLIECKAETVPLTQKTLDQAVTYNRKLNVPYVLLYNGVQTIFVHGENNYTTGYPRYADLLRRE